MAIVLFIVFAILLIVAVPISYGLIISGSSAVLFAGPFPPQIIAQRLFSPTQSAELLAIPFFILAGEFLVSGKMGERLVRFASLLVGRFTGGIGQASILTSMVFAGVSGSAVADASGIGSVMIPWQKKNHYPAPFAAAVNASGSTLGVIIPPSIPLIIYSSVSNASVGALFLAGIVPGLLLAAGLMATCRWAAKRGGYPKLEESPGAGELLRSFVATVPALLMPVFVVVVIVSGIATVTEVSVIAVFYALVVSSLLYRDLNLKRVWDALVRTATATGAVMLILMASSLVGWILTVEQLPNRLTEWFTSTSGSYFLAILFMNAIMLVVGTFLDMPAAILILGPVFVPLASAIGLDLVQLGIIMTVNLAIGLFTPPVGTVLYISTTIAQTKMEQTARALVPFYVVALIVLLLVSYIPAITITS